MSAFFPSWVFHNKFFLKKIFAHEKMSCKDKRFAKTIFCFIYPPVRRVRWEHYASYFFFNLESYGILFSHKTFTPRQLFLTYKLHMLLRGRNLFCIYLIYDFVFLFDVVKKETEMNGGGENRLKTNGVPMFHCLTICQPVDTSFCFSLSFFNDTLKIFSPAR